MVNECDTCKLAKAERVAYPELLQSLPVPKDLEKQYHEFHRMSAFVTWEGFHNGDHCQIHQIWSFQCS